MTFVQTVAQMGYFGQQLKIHVSVRWLKAPPECLLLEDFFKAFKNLAISKKGRFKGIKYKQYICMLMNDKVCEEAHCSCSKCSL